MTKSFWKGVGVSYAAFSLLAGLAMGAVLPLNALGVVYTGITWPVAMVCMTARSDCSAVPPHRYAKWLFKEPSQ